MNIPFTTFLFSCLSLAKAIDNTSSDITATSATEYQLANISLRLYTGKTIEEYEDSLIDNATYLLPQLNSSKPTVVYIHGWLESPNSKSVKTVVGAYLERQHHNVILVDWQVIATQSYPYAAFSVSKVGYTIAKGLSKLVTDGLDSTTLHIVSHSLGSQVAGSVGRNVNFTLSRITGLDPAGPGFYILIDDLTAAEASFVDIIHTDAFFYGTATNNGTVDFYPNGGVRFQPGCQILRMPLGDDDYCDHHRSWYYYAESVLNEEAFIGVECSSYTDFLLGNCSSNKKVVMGYATPTTTRGKFYLETNGKSPYGRGKAGEIY